MAGMVMPLEVPLLYRIVLSILGFLFFHMKLIIFTMLILPIQEYGRSFHFLAYSSISFIKDLKFLLKRLFTSSVSIIRGYFMLFVAIVKGEVSLISFSVSFSFVYRRATDIFFGLILYPVTLLKVFISCRSSLVEGFGHFVYYHINCKYESLLLSFQLNLLDLIFVVLLL